MMRLLHSPLTPVVLIAVLASFAGCKSEPTDTSADTDPATEVDTDTDTDTDVVDTDVPTPGADVLRLATWNVSRLDVEGQGDNPRTAEDLALMGTYADRLEADVVALQEVRGVVGTQTLFPAAEWSAECENRDSSQNVCVVLRNASGWTMTRNADLTELDVGNSSLRQGLDLTLSRPGHASLRILALHLKFGCLFGETHSDCGVWFEQLAVVEGWIDARAAAGEPFVVLGDFNRFMTADDSAWLEIDDGDPVGADLTRSIPQGTPTPCWSDVFTEFLDHIVLDSNSTGWLQSSDQLVYDETDFDAYFERLSDHCPVWADFQVPETP